MADEFAQRPDRSEAPSVAVPVGLLSATTADLLTPSPEPTPSDLDEWLDRDRAFASVVDAMATEFATERILVEGLASGASPQLEPLELGDDFDTLEAYALNRAAEGIGFVAPEAKRPAARNSRGSRFTNAIRLTREAVFAWANLLHGPAVVAISH